MFFPPLLLCLYCVVCFYPRATFYYFLISIFIYSVLVVCFFLNYIYTASFACLYLPSCLTLHAFACLACIYLSLPACLPNFACLCLPCLSLPACLPNFACLCLPCLHLPIMLLYLRCYCIFCQCPVDHMR